jgi:hypothetical protein
LDPEFPDSVLDGESPIRNLKTESGDSGSKQKTHQFVPGGFFS